MYGHPFLAVFLGMAHVSAHNWFHQGDKTSWRRFYFDLSFTSSRDWRVSGVVGGDGGGGDGDGGGGGGGGGG